MSEQIDDNYVNGVYVKADGTEQVEIDPQYVYMTVPSKYVCVYHKLLVLMAQYGLDMLNDCSATCKGNNKIIIDCWNTFQSAIACKALKKDKEAGLLIKYITSQIDKLYTGGDYVQQDVFVYLDNNYLKARVSCENNIPKVDVDVDSGYLQVIEDSNTKEFVLKDEDLIVKDK